jgi:hydroxymethylpyrimidine/phosphomethylpyrimidine kinase
MKYDKVLTIAGSDCSGGAGIQADLKTFSSLGCYGMSVITALTAQNTRGVVSVHAIPPAFVEDQLEAVFSDMGADAVKIGMLYSAEIIETVARQLKKHAVKNIVLDPVMIAQSGDSLLQDEAVNALKDLLMPLALVTTPNLPEASVLLNRQIEATDDMEKAARQLCSGAFGSILLKGGHMDGKSSVDWLYDSREDRFVEFKAERIQTRNNHGTGCTLSSAIASFLAKKFSLEESVRRAKIYVTGAIRAGTDYEIGGGHGPLHHFYEMWKGKEDVLARHYKT